MTGAVGAALTITLGVATPLAAAPAHAPPDRGRFTDVTAACGVADVVTRHYENVPKWWLSGITLVDLDGDGSLDLHLASHGLSPSGPAAFAFNDGRGHFTYVDPSPQTPRGPRHNDDLPFPGGEIRLPYDVNEDGLLDLLCSWHDGGGALYLNASKREGAARAWHFRRSDALDPFSRATAVADLDRDGVNDYLADDGKGGHLRVLRGKAGGAFEAEPRLIPALAESAAIPIDLDADGLLDLLVSQRGYNPTKRAILRNSGGMRFEDVTRTAGLDPSAGSIHGVGDLNRDGPPDLVCVEGKSVEIYFNDGHGRFTRKDGAVRGLEKVRSKPDSTNWGGAVVTDLDNDGNADVLITGRHFLYLLRGAGDGTLDVMNEAWGVPTGATAAVDEGLCFGDIDNDGDLDLVTCGPGPAGREKEKGVSVFRNDLAGAGKPLNHWLRVRPSGKPGNRAAAGAKIRLYAPGSKDLLACEQVAVWGRQSFHSYYAHAGTERHFGLGAREAADVELEFYPSGTRVRRAGVHAGTVLDVRETDAR